jgi:RNA polymerase sigma-32 factor
MKQMSQSSSAGYLAAVRLSPKLSREREHELALRWRGHGDTSARDELVRSQLRHVVAIARRYRAQNCATLDELIAEGNFGLLQALEKFDPDRGTRFVTYAVYWIRANISQYLVRSRSLVATGVQSKLLSKIRQERAREALMSGEPANADAKIADDFALSPARLRALVERLDVRDVAWDAAQDEACGAPLAELLESLSQNAEESALSNEAERHRSVAISDALLVLDVRERYIVERRHMAHPEDQLSLAEIGRRLSVSRERVRQIEVRAIRKLKTALIGSAASSDWLARLGAA